MTTQNTTHQVQTVQTQRTAAPLDTDSTRISHYFKDKNGLLEATMRDITGQLRDAVLSRLHALPNASAERRLQAIVGGNFDETQVSSAAMKAWLAFWASSMHQPMLYRLQQVSSRRLLSNLVYEFRRALPREQAQEAGYGLAALIDGLWLRAALSGKPLKPSDPPDVRALRV
jgi:TetR/AcrR family transcriptional repressor of bet genes